MAETELEWYLAKVLDTITEGVAVISADGCYAFANRAAQRILGAKMVNRVQSRWCEVLRHSVSMSSPTVTVSMVVGETRVRRVE